MDAPGDLPAGLTGRALTVHDIDAVVELANACETHDVGFTMWDREDLTSDFRLEGVDVRRDTIGVWDGDRLVGWGFLPNERDGFEANDLMLARDGEEIVGGAFLIDPSEIWVDKFAVRSDHRDQGIARPLLQVAFQRSFDRGYTRTTLSTDSDRSAITFYEKVGVRVRESYTHLVIDL